MSKIKCPICSAQIEHSKEIIKCPACKEDISSRINTSKKGITTARAEGPGLHPVNDLEQDVF